jgi:hypothetical protein
LHAYADVANATICLKAKSVNTKTQTNVTPTPWGDQPFAFFAGISAPWQNQRCIFNARSSFGTKIALNVLPENTGANG